MRAAQVMAALGDRPIGIGSRQGFFELVQPSQVGGLFLLGGGYEPVTPRRQADHTSQGGRCWAPSQRDEPGRLLPAVVAKPLSRRVLGTRADGAP